MKRFAWVLGPLALALVAGCAVQVNEDGEIMDQSSGSLELTGGERPDDSVGTVQAGGGKPTPDPYAERSYGGGKPTPDPYMTGGGKPTPDPYADEEDEDDGDPAVNPWGIQFNNSEASGHE